MLGCPLAQDSEQKCCPPILIDRESSTLRLQSKQSSVSNAQISAPEENEDGVTVKRLEVDPSEHDDGSQNGGTTQDDGIIFEQMAHAIQLVKSNIQDN